MHMGQKRLHLAVLSMVNVSGQPGARDCLDR